MAGVICCFLRGNFYHVSFINIIFKCLFLRVFEITGPFVAMIYKMIAGDIFSFSIIYSLLLFGFSLAFYYLYKNAGIEPHETYIDFGEAIMITFQMTLGDFKVKTYSFKLI